MKVLILNGSPHENGNTAIAIRQIIQVFDEKGVDTEVVQVGNQTISGCKGCGACKKLGRCFMDDCVNEIAEKLKACDGMIIATPVHFATPTAALLACLDRLFYVYNSTLTMKVGAAVVCTRRSGATTTFDTLNKYFTYANMPVCSSQYWNNVHGGKNGSPEGDLEGMMTLRNLAGNMVFLMKSIALGKEAYGIPQIEREFKTDFMR